MTIALQRGAAALSSTQDDQAGSERGDKTAPEKRLVAIATGVASSESAGRTRARGALLAPDDVLPTASVAALHTAAALPPALPAKLMRVCTQSRRSYFGGLLYRIAKRGVDIGLSVAGLIAAMPILLGAALLVRLTSKGPIFYLQERWGRDGRRFKIIKFRSMVHGADRRVTEMAEFAKVAGLRTTDAPVFKSVDDPRITKAGRILRRTNLDELPQLFNVLAGHMSLVGPRPLVRDEATVLTPDESEQRHAVRPGLTCLWQVLREEETTFSERIQLDLFYVGHASFALDLMLIAMTPRAIVGGRGSY